MRRVKRRHEPSDDSDDATGYDSENNIQPAKKKKKRKKVTEHVNWKAEQW